MTSHDPIDHPSGATEPDAASIGRPATEPGPAVLRDDAPPPGPQAPDDPAPDMADISSGDGPGVSPGE